MKLLIITKSVNKDDQLLGFFIDWLKLFADNFQQVNVLCLEKGEFYLSDNVKVFSLGKERGVNKIKQFFTFIFSLFTLDYDAVFVHMNPIWMAIGGPICKLLGKKRFLWYTSGGVTFKLKVAEKFADKIFTASPESFRLKSKKVIITGHGIDTRLFQPSEKLKEKSENLKILSVGRISPVKNYDVLIDACRILKDKEVNFEVTMVGEPALDGDKLYLESLKSKVKSLKLEDNFKFIGKINHKNLPEYYQSHDIFIHLSKTGSLDKTMLEAMACGIVVLSSNDAARNILSHDLIFNDDAKELADKILNSKNTDTNFLRNYVVENHNLANLISKISNIIQS